MFVPREGGGYDILAWSRGIPDTNQGRLKMVDVWSDMGFVLQNPAWTPTDGPDYAGVPKFYEVERNKPTSS